MTLLHSIVPSAMSGKGHGSALFSAGLPAPSSDPLFASFLAALQTQQTNTSATGTSDPISQLGLQIQNGTTTLPTIVNQISQDLGQSLQQQLSGQLPQKDLDRLTSSIIQQIGNALSPPGTAPPGTPAQQVRALAARIQRLVASIARDAKQTGQLNEIAGNVLDAKSAKELPAQIGSKTASTLDVSSVVQSLLSGVITALQNGATNSAKTRPGYVADPLVHNDSTGNRVSSYTDPTHVDRRARPPQTQVNAEIALSTATPSAPAASNATDAATVVPSNPAPTSNASAPSVTMESAPDLLARMLVRAAGVDAKISGNAAVSSGTSQTLSTSSQAPSAILARFEAAIAAVVQSDVSSNPNGSQTTGQFARSFSQQLGQQSSNDTNAIASAQVAPAPNTLQAQAQAQQVAPSSHVDVNAVIEQMIKGMAMRTNSQGSSEIRLHLQPENLGQLTMKITVTGSQISANVVAQNADVRSTLMANHQQLARSLQNSGLTLSGFSVDVSGGDAGSRDQNQTRGFGRHYVIHELANSAANETPALSSPGPALMSGNGLELFNYLV